MEQLFSIRKFLAFIFFTVSFVCHSQNNFIIFKVSGNPILKVNDSLKPCLKGSIIDNTAVISTYSSDLVLLINEQGDLIKIPNTGVYNFSSLNSLKVEEVETSFTKNYLKYVWNQFTNNTSKNTKGGVVYRINFDRLMIFPFDSAKIYFPEIRFSWNINPKKITNYYFILKDLSSDHVTKIGSTNDSLVLFVDNTLLKRGHSYEWTVSIEKYPNLDELTFFEFEILNTQQFKDLQNQISLISSDLHKLGFSLPEIKTMLCEDYKICY